MKKILAITLTLCMVMTLATVFGVSAAAESNTYTMTQVYNNGDFSIALSKTDVVTISSAEELNYLAAFANAGKAYRDILFVLKADITLNEGTFDSAGNWSESGTPAAFTPIGLTADTAFTCRFDGQNHVIKGLYVNSDTVAGLFGYLNSYYVRRVQIENAYVSGTTYAGTLAAVAVAVPQIRTVCVDNATVKAGVCAGGVIGLIKNQSYAIPVTGCSFAGTVLGDEFAGGIVGYAENTDIYLANNSVTGTIKGTVGVGGILGIAMQSAEIVNCYSAANVTAETAAGGIVGGIWNGTVNNCLSVGKITATDSSGAIIGLIGDAATAQSCYFLSGSASGSGIDTGATEVDEKSVSSTLLSQMLNVFVSSGENIDNFYGWTVRSGSVTLASETPAALVTVGNQSIIAATLADAAQIARTAESATVKLLHHTTTTGITEIGGTYTLNLNGKTVTTKDPLTISFGTLTITDTESKGSIIANNSAAIVLLGGTLKLNKGYIYSATSFALQNNGQGEIYLSGSPRLVCENSANVYIGYPGTLYGNDGAETDPVAYNGERVVTVACGFNAGANVVIVKNATAGKFSSKYIRGFAIKTENGNLIYDKLATGSWWLIGALFLSALALLIVTIIRTVRYKARMKTYSFVPFLPLLVFTGKQTIFLIIAGVTFAACLLLLIISTSAQKKKENAAKNRKKEEQDPAEENPAEESVEETPAEEPVKEPVEETPAEEAPVEETPAEEPAEEESAEEESAEEESAEETPVEESEAAAPPAAKGDSIVIAETDTAGNTVYSIYKKSFTARLIQSETEVQQRYEDVKNALLSYKKVNSRVSWSYDSFKTGHTQLAKMTVRGKTLHLYLALDPKKLEGSKYNVTDAGKAKKYSTVPCRMRLTSKRSVKWAIELIGQLAEQEGLTPNPKFKPETYVMENETTEALIEKGLIKKMQ